jgi:hypothetical protein
MSQEPMFFLAGVLSPVLTPWKESNAISGWLSDIREISVIGVWNDSDCPPVRAIFFQGIFTDLSDVKPFWRT